jgi:Fe-S cluster assembly iron-binding protein IscA
VLEQSMDIPQGASEDSLYTIQQSLLIFLIPIGEMDRLDSDVEQDGLNIVLEKQKMPLLIGMKLELVETTLSTKHLMMKNIQVLSII